jgi:hypothetical protein
MTALKKFEEFVKSGVVKKQSPDTERALSLLKESEDQKAFFSKVLGFMPFEQVNANYVIATCYDVIMETIRAIMYLNGLKSKDSHEAEVAYLRNLGFSEQDVLFMNDVRYFRNGIKYYGKILDIEYAKKVKAFFDKTYPILAKQGRN